MSDPTRTSKGSRNKDAGPTDLHSAVKPFLYTCSLFGLVPIRLVSGRSLTSSDRWADRRPRDSKDSSTCTTDQEGDRMRYQISAAGVVYSIALGVLIITAAPFQAVNIYKFMTRQQLVLTGWLHTLCYLLVTTVVLMFMALFPIWARIGKILEILSGIDDILIGDKNGFYRFIRKFLLWELSVIYVLLISYLTLSFMFLYPDIINMCCTFAGRLLVVCVHIMFDVTLGNVAFSIRQRLFHLNGQISKFSATYRSERQPIAAHSGAANTSTTLNSTLIGHVNRSSDSRTVFSLTRRVRSLRKAHSRVCDVVHGFNESFGLLIFLSLICNFIEIFTFLHTLVILVYKGDTPGSPPLFFYRVFMLTLSVTFMTLSCDCASSEGGHTGVLLQRMTLLKAMDQDTKEEIQLFLQQFTNREIRFTAGRFFTIDRAMLFSTLGAIVTYLVVLVQFQEG